MNRQVQQQPPAPVVEADDDDTADSLDGLILSVVDSLGDENPRVPRPTSAPPVENNSVSQSLFLGERNRTDSIQEFLTKSPGQMLGSGIRKRAQPPRGEQQQQMIRDGITSLEEVFLPQLALSSPSSPLDSTSRFDFLNDTPRVPYQNNAPRQLSQEINHQRSVSQGNYGFQMGQGFLPVVSSSTTPHSSPPLSEVGDAIEDQGDETMIQLQIEELQKKLNWQRQLKIQQHQRTVPDWSVPPTAAPRQPTMNILYPPHFAGPQPSPVNVNGNGHFAPFPVHPQPEDFRHFSTLPTMSNPKQQPHKLNGMVSPPRGASANGNSYPQPQQQQQQQPPQTIAGSTPSVGVPGFPAPFPQEKLPVDAPLEQLEGRFLQLAQEQNGCRYLQQRITREGPSGASLVLREVFPHLVQLMMDPFANYMYQKLLEHAAPEQRLQMLQAVQDSLLVASLNLHGTRSVQKHIEMGGRDPQQRDIIAAELSPFVTKLSMDTNGNHVVQRMLQHLDHCEFVCEAIIQDLLIVTRHRHGCCVVQRSLDAADAPHRAALVARIEENALQLMQDPFANYTVQYVIENGNPGEGLRIVELIRGKIETLSKQKFSSNVVERCIAAAPPHILQGFVDEAIGCMGELLHDAFANFVAQKLLDPITSDTQARAVVAAMRPHLLDLNPSCSRRVANRIVKRFPDMMNDDVVQKVLGGVVPLPVAQSPPPPHVNSMFRGHPNQHQVRQGAAPMLSPR